MKLIYMDESTRDFLDKAEDSIFIYGALIIEKENVAKALEIYKKIFTYAKNKIRVGLKKDEELKKLDVNVRAQAIEKVLNKFEIHSYELFNPKLNDTNRKGDIIKYNPWNFIDKSERLGITESLFTELKPLISKIFMFQIQNKSFNELYPDKSIKEKRDLANDHIIKYVLTELNVLGTSDNHRVALVMDTLDSEIRDAFVKEISEEKYPNLWSEPIIVESYKNAFIQLIDLFTYVFYLDYSNKFEKRRLKRVRNAYRSQIKDLVITKDLVNSLTADTVTGSTTPAADKVAPIVGSTTLAADSSAPVAGRAAPVRESTAPVADSTAPVGENV